MRGFLDSDSKCFLIVTLFSPAFREQCFVSVIILKKLTVCPVTLRKHFRSYLTSLLVRNVTETWARFSECWELSISEIQEDLNLKKNIRIIHASFSIKSLIKQFLSSIYYAFIHHTIHVTSYMDTWHSEVRWPC